MYRQSPLLIAGVARTSSKTQKVVSSSSPEAFACWDSQDICSFFPLPVSGNLVLYDNFCQSMRFKLKGNMS
jgi:hypothetical protein